MIDINHPAQISRWHPNHDVRLRNMHYHLGLAYASFDGGAELTAEDPT